MLKRIIALCLCAAMIATMLPSQVFASESTEEQIKETTATENFAASEETAADSTIETAESAETEPECSTETTAPEETVQITDGVSAAYSAQTVGNTIGYTFDEATKTLTITGEGPMPDYYLNSSMQYGIYPPWWGYTAEAEKIVIADGITYVGEYAFYEINYSCRNMKELVIGDSVEEIGAWAFRQSPKLEKLTLGKKRKGGQ